MPDTIDLGVLEVLGLDAGSLIFAGIALIVAIVGSFFLIYYIEKKRLSPRPRRRFKYHEVV